MNQTYPFCSFKCSRTNFFHNLITNYSESTSNSCFRIFIILSGCERLSSFFSTKAMNFYSTPPMYSLLISSSQGLMFLYKTTDFESLSQSIPNYHSYILFWGTFFSNYFIAAAIFYSYYLSIY